MSEVKHIVWSDEKATTMVTKHEQKHNPIHIWACTPTRHAACAKNGQCAAAKPRCMVDEFKYAGKNYLSTKFQCSSLENQARVRRQVDAIVEKKLKAAFKRCKQYELTIRRLENGEKNA